MAVIYNDSVGQELSSLHPQKAAITFMMPHGQNKYKWPRKQQIESIPLHEVLAV